MQLNCTTTNVLNSYPYIHCFDDYDYDYDDDDEDDYVAVVVVVFGGAAVG